jgi:hypothetical protein
MAVRAGTGPDGARRGTPASTSGAPQVAQKALVGPTGEAHRGQVGPEPGALSRRPHCGQKGWSALARPPQNGQSTDSAGLGATAVRGTGRVPGSDAPAPAAAARTPGGPPMGLPQSMQNCAPASLCRPQ